MDHEYDFNFLNSLPTPVFCLACHARRFTLDTPCPRCKRSEEARNPSLPLERFRCSKCKCFRPITDYPLDSRDFRAATCSACHTRRRDSYREQRGMPVSQEGRVRRFKRAQRVVEKALRTRIRREEVRERAVKAQEREEWWERTGQELWREAIQKGEDPRIQGWEEAARAREGLREGESSTGVGKGWEGLREGREGFAGGSEAWEGLREEEESWEGAMDGEEGSASESEAWKGPQESGDKNINREESLRGSTGPQEQYCSSCNQKKPLIDFGRFLTCNPCREKNKRVKEARRVKHKASYIAPKATQAELERSLRAWDKRSEFKLLLNTQTRPLALEDYINKSS
ncbi:hypothetical protein BGZ57DRAFT_1004729 [Hyaloscypha finlandica]|nr:hypothetical protein BGZ57DRAFT_1004729 [Hyaloscypha finlandica]